jgi:hypothetical protein
MPSHAEPPGCPAPQVLGLALRHGSPSLAQDVAAAVVPALTLTAGELAAQLGGSFAAEGAEGAMLQRASSAAGTLLEGLRLADAPPCDAQLAGSPTASCGLGLACARLSQATPLAGSPQQLLGLSTKAALVSGRCLSHARAAAEGGGLSWAGLFELARAVAALPLLRETRLQPPGEHAHLAEVCGTALDALTAHGQQVGLRGGLGVARPLYPDNYHTRPHAARSFQQLGAGAAVMLLESATLVQCMGARLTRLQRTLNPPSHIPLPKHHVHPRIWVLSRGA